MWLLFPCSSAPPTRKYNEKQSQHKTKMRQVKQAFLKATTQRDSTIQKLENDLMLASSLTNKVMKSLSSHYVTNGTETDATLPVARVPFAYKYSVKDVCVVVLVVLSFRPYFLEMKVGISY